ncbi:ABC transporter ATP-binding protein [Thioclava sp.]|uniref:ABC transporter ATP-binding protein n=1 Tax=Thioclava sp. TaxID=1933450 RepID=UPI003AA9537D
MTQTLSLSHITKGFNGVTALSDVSLEVAAGERVALLGHNGAGKSTLMKIVLGLMSRDGGEVSVAGAAPGTARARRAVAYLPENVAFHPALTGLEQIRYYLRLRGETPALAPSLLDRVGMGDAARRRIGTYSKGMRQRVGLAQALIGAPELMVLDEPTSGLDPISRRDFYTLLDDLARRGTAILLSSHALTEVEARTDRIIILSNGVVAATGSLAELRKQAALPVALVVTPREGALPVLAQALPDATLELGGQLHLECAQEAKLALLARITELSDHVADLDVIPPSLEDIYSHFSRGAVL